jgi:hypothetical protein
MTSLRITDTAVVSGDLIYRSPKKALIAGGAEILGETIHEASVVAGYAPYDPTEQLKKFKKSMMAGLAAFAFLKYLAILAAALLLTMWFTKRSQALVDNSLKRFGNNLLTGFLVCVAAPLLLIILLFTGIGMMVSLLGGAVLIALMVLSGIFAGVMLGVYIRRVWTKSKKVPADWKSVLLGVTLLHLVYIIPVIGMLFKWVLLLAVLGASCRMLYAYLTPKTRK